MMMMMMMIMWWGLESLASLWMKEVAQVAVAVEPKMFVLVHVHTLYRNNPVHAIRDIPTLSVIPI